MTSIYSEYRVHHSSVDGILLQLPGNSGFGRLTRATMGDDSLADRLLKSFSKRDRVPAIMQRARDSQGYRLLTVQLSEGWSELLSYPQPVRRLVPQLLRKHLLVGLGTTTVAHLLKQSEKGSVLSVAPNMTAVAAYEQMEGPEAAGSTGASSTEVRVLNFDVDANVLNVTLKSDVIERTPLDTAVASTVLASMTTGSRVQATVLLSSTDDGCAVVEVPSTTPAGDPCSVLGYYIYAWSAQETAEPPVVGTTLTLWVEFAAELPALQEMLHFVILSQRLSFVELPAVRRRPSPAADPGLLGYLPWRGDAMAGVAADIDDEAHGEGDGQPRIRRRKLEEAIDAYERAMDTTVPTSPEEFQRLLLATPNSSYLWTQYIAFHVGLQQLEDARQVAEKALSTIGVRETEERLNVWVAYLNVENLHGTAESLATVFKRAASRQLDPFVLHERLADIFQASRKNNQLLALCRSMTSKFRNQRRAWERLGVCLVDQDKRDQLKRVIKDMTDALRKDEVATTIVHIAIHEYKRGSVENGRALFEGLLAKTPKKSDVWSTYIDQELGLLNRRAPESSVTHVRNILERAVAMSFTAKVMHQFLTRFLAFEKAFGTPAEVEKVKERARTYVESKIQAVTGTGV